MMETKETTYFEKQGLLTVRHLCMRGSNFGIGRQLGEIAIQRYGHTSSAYRADPVYASARRVYFQRNYPVHWERTRGVAAAFGVDPNDDSYDFTFIRYNVDLPVAPGCSAVYYPPKTTATGRGYLSRNYDFSIGTIADLLRLPVAPQVNAQLPAIMCEPYVMEWQPTDGGYSSLSIQAFDVLAGTLDGINGEGLVVSILADEEAIATLGPGLETQLRAIKAIGVHELQVMRLLLDTCATVEEAREILLTAKQFYWLVPCHYIVADRTGKSFIYENSTGRNLQHVIDGHGNPQVITNFQVHKHPNSTELPPEGLTIQNNAFWRYATLSQQIEQQRHGFTSEAMRTNHACVNIHTMLQQLIAGPEGGKAVNAQSRTLWHALYDQQDKSVEFSFYLGEETAPDGTHRERRSEILKFSLR